tara:strand:- start:77954 stop:78820 length:867 start_codon:yes stop_codon:yes gene_type:complete
MSYKNSYKNLTIGSDPEIFLKNEEDDSLSSVIGIFNAGKLDPMDIGNGCYVQEDNILAEFNIPPCTSKEAFLESMNYAKDYISLIIAPLSMKLHFASSEMATDDILLDEKAHVFGCEPSYNSITENMIEIDPDEIEGMKMRSAGFHIHIGFNNDYTDVNGDLIEVEATDEERDRIVMFFELNVTLPLLLEDVDDYNRRKFYGKIGDMRDKKYGVECRSLGGYFLKDDDSIGKIWDLTLKAVKMAKESTISNEELRADISKYINPKEDLDIGKVNELLIKYKKTEYVNS